MCKSMNCAKMEQYFWSYNVGMFVAGLVDWKGSKSPWTDSNVSLFLQKKNLYNETDCGIMHQISNTPMTIPIIN